MHISSSDPTVVKTEPEKKGYSPTLHRSTQAENRPLASWSLGVLLILFLIGVFVFAPPILPVYKQRVLAVIVALATGMLAYFFIGSLSVVAHGGKGVFGRFNVKASSGFAMFVLVLAWWLSPWAPIASADIFRLRVLVLGPEGIPLEGAKIWTSVGGEPKQVPGGWELDLPLSKLPNDGRITLYATKESAYLQGSQEVSLDERNLHTPVILRLKADRSQSVRGVITDVAGHALSGVRVNVVGYGEEAVTTGPDGQFILPAHAANGQMVQLHAEKPGYTAITQIHPAGAHPATINLERP